jgi:tetratricopeptide (TPR) repeat protein
MHMMSKLMRTTTFAAALVGALGLLASGCAEKVAGSEATPSEALKKTMEAAKSGNVEEFKKGLSTNFILVIDRYQEMGKTTPEVKDAFKVETFMRALANSPLDPKEEIVKGNKATVRAIDVAGNWKSTEMVLENGVWKLEVPDAFVTGLDHYDETVKRVKGEAVMPKADLARGGGGKADRAKNLPADATAEQKAKAKALDTFDLGDVKGAITLMEEALKKNPEDEELTVALGRAYVQESKGKDAVKLLADFLKNKPDSSPARHYIGMAYMFEKEYKLAAGNWDKIVKEDPDYAKQWDLENRAKIADAMGRGVQFVPVDEQGNPVPGMGPGGQAPPPGGAASQPGAN